MVISFVVSIQTLPPRLDASQLRQNTTRQRCDYESIHASSEREIHTIKLVDSDETTPCPQCNDHTDGMESNSLGSGLSIEIQKSTYCSKVVSMINSSNDTEIMKYPAAQMWS